MSLFDSIREKAAELLSGATEQVEEVTGNIPGGQAVEDVTGTAQDLGESATGTVNEVTDTVSGSITETAETAGEAIDPYRP